jgi:hypothetical protein
LLQLDRFKHKGLEGKRAISSSKMDDFGKAFVAYTYTSEDKSSKRRKAVRFWVLFVLTVAFLLIVFSFAVWQFSPRPSCRVLVVDKTVPHTDYREHQSLFWVLNNSKVTNKGGKRKWRPGRDYVGFYPEKFIASDAAFSSKLEEVHLVGIDCLFLVDTYGVYVDDYRYPEKQSTHLDFSKKIFGGLLPEEADVIEDFVRGGGSLVAEFNSFYPPTPEQVQERMERLLGLNSSGWVGRYFSDLSNRQDVPSWALRHWKMQYGRDWDFTGPGYIISHKNTDLFVLEEGIDVEVEGLMIEPVLPGDSMMKGVSSNAPYGYWFDIVSAENGTEVLARYRFKLTRRGKEKTREFFVPETFPAVLRASRSPLRIYFAGDFSDNNIPHGPHFLYGWSQFRRALSGIGRSSMRNKFFWSFYVPLLRNLFGLNYS